MVALPVDPFYSAKLRLIRAKDHLDYLIGEFDRFFQENPGGYVAEPDPDDGTHIIHKVKFTKRFPVEWRAIATEIIEHMRASLDHATFAAFFHATGRMDSNHAAFPFGKTATDLNNSVRGRSKDLRPEIQTLLRGFNAYKGGNDLLYTLNDLANNCKHGLVAFIVGAIAAIEVMPTMPFGLVGVQLAEPPVWDSEKNEIAYARVKLGTNFEHQGKVRVYVAIPNTEHLARGPAATAVLEDIGGEVCSVVAKIEAECRSIGILK
jgi:hypothetical protein